MTGTKRGAIAASTLMLLAMLISACEQPYSQAPNVTNTPIDPNSLFATPISGPTQSNAELFATQTASGANPNPLFTSTPGSAPQIATATQTPIVSLPATSTNIPTSTLAVPGGSGPTPTLVPGGTRVTSYILKAEEFPFCIARRYNVDPGALLAASQLTSPDIYYSGLELKIPQDPTKVWPVQDLGPRALKPHPATYVVTGNADSTVYGVACKFGDVDPSAIVANPNNAGITLNSTLNVGQTLSIP